MLSILLALVIGLFTGLGRISRNPVINGIASLYVEVIRGIPLLVQLFYIYFGLGRFVQLPPLPSAVIAMAVCYGAYMGEIFRAGIQSIPKGQTEAARSLGMTPAQSMYHVILPQAVKTILPPVGNEFIALIKDTALVSTIAMVELMRAANQIYSSTFNVFILFQAALVYLVLTSIFTVSFRKLEDRLGVYENR